jgi:hypothetical protein
MQAPTTDETEVQLPEVTPTSSTGPTSSGPIVEDLNLATDATTKEESPANNVNAETEDEIAEGVLSYLESNPVINDASIPEHAPYIAPHPSSSSLPNTLENNSYQRGFSNSSVFTIGSALDGGSSFSLSSLDIPLSPLIDNVMDSSGTNEQQTLSPPLKLPNLSHFPQEQREELKQMYLAGFRDAKEKVRKKKQESIMAKQHQVTSMRHTDSQEELRTNFAKARGEMLSTSAPAAIRMTRSSSRQTVLPTGGISHNVVPSPLPLDNDYDEELLDDLLGTSPSESPPILKKGKARQSHSNPFPRKLFDMLMKEETAVVSWLPKGDAFIVRDNDRFVGDILPRYFRHTKVSVFVVCFGVRRMRAYMFCF